MEPIAASLTCLCWYAHWNQWTRFSSARRRPEFTLLSSWTNDTLKMSTVSFAETGIVWRNGFLLLNMVIVRRFLWVHSYLARRNWIVAGNSADSVATFLHSWTVTVWRTSCRRLEHTVGLHHRGASSSLDLWTNDGWSCGFWERYSLFGSCLHWHLCHRI